MRREIPLVIAFLAGSLMIASFFVPAPFMTKIGTTLPSWNAIIGGFAYILGLTSLVRVHGNRISRRDEGWSYSVVLLAALAVTMFFGFSHGAEEFYTENAVISEEARTQVLDAAHRLAALKDRDQIVKHLEASLPTAGRILHIDRLATLENNLRAIAAADITRKIDRGGDTAYVSPVSYFNPFHWIFLYVYSPLQATMVSLLAFYVASAAYRAFRARTVEGTLLLVAAFLVMLGRVPLGYLISCKVSFLPLPQIQEWIMEIPTTAGQRAIMIGAALGVISSSIRMLLGYEQSYLGSE